MVATKLVTAEELAEFPEDERVELIDGELIEMSPTQLDHVVIVSRLIYTLNLYQSEWRTIRAWAGEGGYIFRRGPDTVLVPDISVVTKSQLRGLKLGQPGMIDLIPTIAIEVKSPSDRESQIARKLAIYLETGVREVWWVRPDDRQVSIHRQETAPQVLAGTGTIESPELLPGFSLPLADLFAPIDEE
jgi:Uma2 family endonuclease